MALVIANGWSVWWLVLAGVLFGGGFGMVQNGPAGCSSLPRKVSRPPRCGTSGRHGIGSVVLGFIAARAAYSGAYAVAAGIVVIGILATLADRYLGAHRVTDHDNIRTRLRQLPVPRRRK